MIVLCGVDEFPAGSHTEESATLFAERLDAELLIVNGGSAAHYLSAFDDETDQVLLFGHAPRRNTSAMLREAPCPVVVAPTGVVAGNWDEVVLGTDGARGGEEAAATAGELAAGLGGVLRIVATASAQRPTGSQGYDALRRLSAAAREAGGSDLGVIEAELRDGPPAQELLRAAGERDTSVLVVGAEPRPSWFDLLRPSFLAQLIHDSRDLVVVVPVPAPSTDQNRRGVQRIQRASA